MYALLYWLDLGDFMLTCYAFFGAIMLSHCLSDLRYAWAENQESIKG